MLVYSMHVKYTAYFNSLFCNTKALCTLVAENLLGPF